MAHSGHFYLNMAANVPVTIWRTTDGNTDNVYTGITDIVDESGNYLIDTLGNFIIDTGINMPLIPVSVWEENDGE